MDQERIRSLVQAVEAAMELAKVKEDFERLSKENREMKMKIVNHQEEVDNLKSFSEEQQEYLRGEANDYKKQCFELRQEVETLKKTLNEQRKVMDAEKQKHEQELGEIDSKFVIKVNTLENELQTLARFSEVKKQLEDELKAAKDMIEAQKLESASKMEEMERQLFDEKQKLKASCDLQIRNMQEKMSEEVNKALSMGTFNAVQENQNLNAELQYQSNQMHLLMETLKQLERENKQLRVKLEMKEHVEKDFAIERSRFKHMIESLQQAQTIRTEAHQRIHVVLPPGDGTPPPSMHQKPSSPRRQQQTLTQRKQKLDKRRQRFFP